MKNLSRHLTKLLSMKIHFKSLAIPRIRVPRINRARRETELNSPVTNSFIKHVFFASSTSCLNFSSSALLVIYFRKKRSADNFKSREKFSTNVSRGFSCYEYFSGAALTSSDIERTYQMCFWGESESFVLVARHLKSNKIHSLVKK